jgi:16S rRNA (guanine527-N7)-methyltransferase
MLFREKILTLYIQSILYLWYCKIIDFVPGTYVLDGGGGRNSISDSFPETRFHLIDIIAKKIKVVQAVVDGLGLENVKSNYEQN